MIPLSDLATSVSDPATTVVSVATSVGDPGSHPTRVDGPELLLELGVLWTLTPISRDHPPLPGQINVGQGRVTRVRLSATNRHLTKGFQDVRHWAVFESNRTCN